MSTDMKLTKYLDNWDYPLGTSNYWNRYHLDNWFDDHLKRLDDDFAGSAWTVQLDQEDALPLTQQELAVGDGDAFARAEHQLQAVRVTVGAFVIVHVHRTHAEVVVPIVGIGGRVALQELTKVFEQQRFGFLDTHSGRGVAREDVGHAVTESGDAHQLSHLVGDIQELDRLLSLEDQPPEPGGDTRRARKLHR